MESAKVFGSEEECHSCESGWTMYLVSSSHDDDDDDFYYDDHHHHLHQREDSDDDSMASDASSGPIEDMSHLKYHHDEAEAVNYGLDFTNQTEKSVMRKKKKKQKQKQTEVKEDMLLIETRVNNIIHNDKDNDNDDGSGSGADHSYVGSITPMKKGKRIN